MCPPSLLMPSLISKIRQYLRCGFSVFRRHHNRGPQQTAREEERVEEQKLIGEYQEILAEEERETRESRWRQEDLSQVYQNVEDDLRAKTALINELNAKTQQPQDARDNVRELSLVYATKLTLTQSTVIVVLQLGSTVTSEPGILILAAFAGGGTGFSSLSKNVAFCAREVLKYVVG